MFTNITSEITTPTAASKGIPMPFLTDGCNPDHPTPMAMKKT